MLLTGSGQMIDRSSTAESAAVKIDVNARYGFAEGSGQRSSIRTAFVLPLFTCGTLISAERFTCAQAIYTGAS